MNLSEYFKSKKGVGVISTASDTGRVNSAIYATPHIINKDIVGFVMRDRLSHANLQSNPQASYLFHENEPGYKGLRLQLEKIEENEDQHKIGELSRRQADDSEKRFFVLFKITAALDLIGGEPLTIH